MQAFFLNNEQNVLFVWVIVLKIDCFCYVCGKMIFNNWKHSLLFKIGVVYKIR